MAKAKSAEQLVKRLEGKPGPYTLQLHSIALQGKQSGASNVIADDPFQQSGMSGLGTRKLTLPPLGENSLRALIDFHDESNILPQIIDAYQTNIEGFGHRYDKVVPEDEFPKELEAEFKAEHKKLDQFFKYAYADGSYVELRKRLRGDMEKTGIGYWEVIRYPKTAKDRAGQVMELNYIPSWQVRMTSFDPKKVVVEEMRQVGLEVERVKVARHFRVFLQIVVTGGRMQRIWFKEFGDPRRLNARTGEWMDPTERGLEATELKPFRVRHHPVTPYSMPRWIGNLPSVLGSRAAEEVNILYFDNKAIPPLVISVSGGRLTKGTVQRIQDVLENEIKGRENFHRALILEAINPEAGSGKTAGARPTIEIKPLTDKMITDAMFAGYDEANRAKILSAFRLPPILVGHSLDYNRATSDTALYMAEEQVFRPERSGFDFWQNRDLTPNLGTRLTSITSLGPNVTRNEDLVQLLQSGNESGAMTPNIARKIMADILEQEIPLIPEPWGDVPFQMTMAQQQAIMMQLMSIAQGVDPNAPPEQQREQEQQRQNDEANKSLWRKLSSAIPRQLKHAVAEELREAIRAELVKKRRR